MSKYNQNDGPYPSNRGQLISPPNSGGSNGVMNGFPPTRSVGGPSPPPSIGRSSNGTNMYARSESGRSGRDDQNETVLGQHYIALREFLRGRDGKQLDPPSSKAKDKLQRLTSVQFLELSTDVYDELTRRQAYSRRANNGSGAPPFLPPEDNFHPKRNQARQKLSSLGQSRFRDLATDVFTELEGRFPQFVDGDIPRMGSSMSVRPSSRSQTPASDMNGYGAPRGTSRRRPSNASSIRGMTGPVGSDPYGIPPSPGLPPGDFSRPMQKQFQSNTIVPNKSTMVEEDDDPVIENGQDSSYGPGLDRVTSNRETERSAGSQRSNIQSEVSQDMFLPTSHSGADSNAPQTDKKLIEDYQQQVMELRERLDSMEDTMKRKDDELNSVLDGERSRATASNLEKKEWSDMRLRLENQLAQAGDARANMENQLAQAEDRIASLRNDMDRMRADRENEVRDLQDQIGQLEGEVDQARQDARQAAMNMNAMNVNNNKSNSANTDPQLLRENEELRAALKEQQAVTDEVRRSAQESLREMRMLSQKSNSAYERHDELEKTVETLEREVRDWRNRYARTKTQLRNMRASSLGLSIEQDAARYVREKGFTRENGLVKDVHVTKFQISIDELLQKARTDDPEKIIESMKRVVVCVRTITKDVDDSGPKSDDVMQEQGKLKQKVSSMANNFITASKNFASSAGISPVSLLDAAASHLVAAIVDLLKTVKIRATPAGELDDDDDGTITPVDSTGFFSPRSNGQSSMTTQDTLPPPRPFQGLGGSRASADSSAYSPISSPRDSVDPPFARRPMSRGNGGMNGGMAYMAINKNLPLAPTSNPYANINGAPPNGRNVEDLKIYLEDQTAVLVQSIQSLVGSIRGDSEISQITNEISNIVAVVDKVLDETNATGNAALSQRLGQCRDRLMDSSDRGNDIAAKGKGSQDREWRMWTQTLPPIAFEIARETKELRQKVEQIAGPRGDDQFA